jgi:alginate O-acetyltransferase complex protein AlgI
MLFCSYAFLCFFVIVFALYWIIPWKQPRVWLLLAASYYFYASWNHWLALIIFFSASLDFCLAHGIRACTVSWKRKLLVGVSVAANLGLLCYFKYANFFLASLQQMLRACGAETSLPVLRVILPIGISFYTFEAINYIVDVYRGRVQPERNLGNFLLFILFFPHLVAGPIVRAHDFLPQIRRAKRFSWLRAHVGVQFFLMGLFKKFVIADRMALFVDPVFANPGTYSSSAVWCALFAYALQIYGDFSGYTDMALGCAHLLGYHLSKNFNMPYLSRNVSEFWRRWHISLSSWLRDYLFIPLGGSRGGNWFTARNLLITMSLGGLWHGASWNFVLWGLLHGLLLIAHRLFQAVCKGRARLTALLESAPGTAVRIATTCLCVCLCWVLFRAETFTHTRHFFHRLVHFRAPGLHYPMPVGGFLLPLALIMLGHLLAQRQLWQKLAVRLPPAALGAVYSLGMAFALLLAPPTGKAFIYFQF